MQPKLPPELPADPIRPPRPGEDDGTEPTPIDDLPNPDPTETPARL